MLKTCKTCLEIKNYSNFTYSNKYKDNYVSDCKSCVAIRVSKYYKTLRGVMTRIFNGELTSSKDRGHPPPTYTKEELFDWLYLNGIENLFNAWEASNYTKNISPSVDRIDSTKPYTLENIRLVTWKENNDAAYTERKNCKRITKQCRAIRQLTMEGEFIAEFKSIAHAARETNACRSNVNAVCTGRVPNANGFKWEHV